MRLTKRTLLFGLPALLVAASMLSPDITSAASGRYKKGKDGSCYWDPKDDGPNQCTPVKKGRWKKDGDKCIWDKDDTGPDQCQPRR